VANDDSKEIGRVGDSGMKLIAGALENTAKLLELCCADTRTFILSGRNHHWGLAPRVQRQQQDEMLPKRKLNLMAPVMKTTGGVPSVLLMKEQLYRW
jgi:hypothetical protein